MATAAFLCLVVLRVIDTPYDWYWGVLLLALEGPDYLRLLFYWRSRP